MTATEKQIAAYMDNMRQAMQLAQQFFLVHVERCADLGVDPGVALLAMENLATEQLQANLAQGGITESGHKAFTAAVDLIKENVKDSRKTYVVGENAELTEVPS